MVQFLIFQNSYLPFNNSVKQSEEEKVLALIVSDGLTKGQQILIFAPSKHNCSQSCVSLMKVLCPLREGDIIEAERTPNEAVVSAKVIRDDNRSSSKGDISGLPVSSAAALAAAKIVHDNNRPFVSHQRYSDMLNSKKELQSKIQIARIVAITDILAANPQADPQLLAFLSCGFAYHHAGLTMEERGVIEAGFRSGRMNSYESYCIIYMITLFLV